MGGIVFMFTWVLLFKEKVVITAMKSAYIASGKAFHDIKCKWG